MWKAVLAADSETLEDIILQKRWLCGADRNVAETESAAKQIRKDSSQTYRTNQISHH